MSSQNQLVPWLAHKTVIVGSSCLGFGLLALGMGGVISPESASKGYGVPASVDFAWVQVAGARDMAFGVATVSLLIFQRSALRFLVPAAWIVATGDVGVSLGWGCIFPAPFNHIFGSVGVAVLSLATWLDPTLDEPPAKSIASSLQLEGMQRLIHMTMMLGTCCLGFGLLALGVPGILAPAFASKGYGLPVVSDVAWVQVAGIRDAALGVATILLFVFQRSALRFLVPATLVVTFGDVGITLAWGGEFPAPFNHIVGTLGVIVLSILTWLDPTLAPRKTESDNGSPLLEREGSW